MTTTLTILSDTELHALRDCEKTIARGLKTFKEVGIALAQIKVEKLYRAEFATFEDYCRTKWNFDRTYAHRLIKASEVVENVAHGQQIEPNERQARELARLPAEQQPEVWQEVVERTEGKPTAAAVHEVIEERSARREPSTAVLDDHDADQPQVTCWGEAAEAEARDGDTDLDEEDEPNHIGEFQQALRDLVDALLGHCPYLKGEALGDLVAGVLAEYEE
jgi:hypothetical protein